jgi:hypothetical protein
MEYNLNQINENGGFRSSSPSKKINYRDYLLTGISQKLSFWTPIFWRLTKITDKHLSCRELKTDRLNTLIRYFRKSVVLVLWIVSFP